ncbi:hypothetical protein [Luteolibacter marinus]|uniref:hypothetical protein n=1 Tax=Luteolibacter marinus TaxID=2776705 RepID=UPI0018675BDB|nr:hypothetical protein [Luteolibacter marinus]
MRLARPALTVFAAACLTATGEEARTWTDVKGRTLEGTLVKQTEAEIWVRRDNGSRVKIARDTLSSGDLDYLKAAAKAKKSLKGERFDTSKIDPTAWQPRPVGLRLGKLVYPVTLESPHFIVGGQAKVRPAILAAYAEAAERLWTDMASDYPGLVEAFKDRKMPIVLLEDKGESKTLANWHRNHAQESRTVRYSYSLESYTIVAFDLDKDFAKESGFTNIGRAFRLDAKGADHNRILWHKRIHFLSEDILRHWIGDPVQNGTASFSIIRLVASFHREGLICGKIETEVTIGGREVEGFRNSRNWSGITKKLLKDGAQADIETLLQTQASRAEPRDLGFGYGLMHFIHADDERLAGFAKLLEDISEHNESPDAGDFAEALGYESPDELNSAWREYMMSDAFE